MSDNGWIGVDFDGTLAEYDEWKGVGVYGEPIELMRRRIEQWLEEGKTVKIFTARVGGEDEAINQEERDGIQNWCRHNLGVGLDVTCKKDYGMTELWDDRAVRVVKNSGLVSDGRDVEEPLVEPGDIGAAM